jgi:hypothetical protein
MANNSIISLSEIINGGIEIEMYSGDDKFVMNLHNKSCEPLAELGETLLQIEEYYKNADSSGSFPKSFFIFWECRTYQYTLEFILKPAKEIEIQISHCPDIFAGIRTENELRLTLQAKFEKILYDFFDELQKTLLNYGFIGYKKRWQCHDFPIAMFLNLYSIINNTENQQTSLPRCLGYLQEIISCKHLNV